VPLKSGLTGGMFPPTAKLDASGIHRAGTLTFKYMVITP